MSYQLSEDQKGFIERLRDQGDYHLAYRYISEQIDDAVQSGQISRETQRWFDWAEEINGDYPTFINAYARNFSQLSAALDGNSLTPEQFQIGSDQIALSLLGEVLTTGEIPSTPEAIILEDIRRGSEFMGTDPEDFPGTLLAGLLFDTDTINELILNDPNSSVWDKILNGLEQVGKHAAVLASVAGFGGSDALLSLFNDPRNIGNFFDALDDVLSDETLQDVLQEILSDAGVVLSEIPFLQEVGVGLPALLAPVLEILGARETITGGDPLILDLDRSGSVELISLDDSSVYFDFLGDDIAKHIGWIGQRDAFLTHDLDGNGQIDSVNEMFGAPYGLAYLFSTITADFDDYHGFAALASHDSNNDGVISALDDVWSGLTVWRDGNSNGVTDAGELITLDAAEVASIDLAGVYRASTGNPLVGGPQRFDYLIEGHYISHASTYTTTDGESFEIVDAWLNTDLMNTTYDPDYTLDVRTLFLPTLRGYGQLPDLHVSASLDNSTGGLLEQLQAFATARGFTELFSQFDSVRSEVEDIMFGWAGIDRAAMEAKPNFGANGIYGLMPEYHFVRTLMGQNNNFNGTWLDFTGWLPTVSDGVGAVHESYQNLVDAFAARLIFQSGGDTLFESGVNYNPFSDEFEGAFALSQSAINNLTITATNHSDVEGFWNNIARFIDGSIGLESLSSVDSAALENAVRASSAGALEWDAILTTTATNVIQAADGGISLTGTAFDDQITGGNGNDSLVGDGGDDTFIGLDGFTVETNDIYIGGEGNDLYLPGLGNDTFQYDSGDDVIVLGSLGGDIVSSTNTIKFGAGISREDVSFHSMFVEGNTPNLLFHVFHVENHGTISVQFPGNPNFSDLIDEFHFDDGSILTFDDIPASYHGDRHNNARPIYGRQEAESTTSLFGYEGDDDLSLYNGSGSTAWVYGGIGNDTLSAFVDNDANLFGGAGDDTYIMGTGDKTVYFEGGHDFIRGIDGQFAGNNAGSGVGYEIVVMPDGIAEDDLTFWRIVSGAGQFLDLRIDVSDLGSMTIRNQFLGTSYSVVEDIQFSDGSSISLADQTYITRDTQGDDRFIGGYGWPSTDDIYQVSGGNDVIQDDQGDDTVIFPEGIALEDLHIFKRGFSPASVDPFRGTDLFIEFGNGHSLEIEFYEYGPFRGQDFTLETLRFADGSEVSMLDLEIEVHGTDASENHFGVGKDASPNDVMFGYGGDDDLYGGAGRDTITGGDGDDYISGGEGEDEAVFSGGFANYEITENGSLVYVSDNTGSDGFDTLHDVERLTFSDGFLEDGEFTAFSDIYTNAPQILTPTPHIPFDPIRQFVSEISQGAITTIDVLDDDLTNGDTLHFTLFGEDADQFSIHNETGTIRPHEPLTNPFGSYDGDAVYELIVMVEDLSGMVDFVEVDYLLFVGG